MSTAVSDPFDRVLDLGTGPSRLGSIVGIIGALALHGAAAARGATALIDVGDFAELTRDVVKQRLHRTYDVEMKEDKPPPPPPPMPEPEPAPRAQTAGPAPPPTPAEAGKVLTAEPDPDEPVDLTGEGFVTGTGDRFAGGVTSSDGKSKTAVYDRNAQKDGVPGGTGTAPAQRPPAPSRDLSRPPKNLNSSWNCGFPPEADVDQIDYATVMISVTVGTDGRARSVAVVSDPGSGFGRQAKQCAFRMQYAVGLDATGQPVTKTTPVITVRFTR